MDFTPELIEPIAKAKHLVVLTGAGVSQESGIPTFRDADGPLGKVRPATTGLLAGIHQGTGPGLGMVRMAPRDGFALPAQPGTLRHRRA